MFFRNLSEPDGASRAENQQVFMRARKNMRRERSFVIYSKLPNYLSVFTAYIYATSRY